MQNDVCEYVIIFIHDYIYKARSNIEKALYYNIQIVLKMSPPPQHAKMLFSPLKYSETPLNWIPGNALNVFELEESKIKGYRILKFRTI